MQRHAVFTLVLPTAALVVLGLVALMSTSAFAPESQGNPTYLLQKQAIWLCIASVIAITTAIVDYHFWEKSWWLWFALAAVLLALCFVPGIGIRVNGSSRWINLGISNFQPSELGKLAVLFFLAFWYARHEDKIRTFKHGILIPGALIGILMALIVIEVDIGTTALIGCVFLTLMFVAGVNLKMLAPIVLLLPISLVIAIYAVPQRLGRVMAFMNLEQYKEAEGYQQFQGLIALGSGGIQGLGLGNGRQKMRYLPEAHTDFIFPIIGEELGLFATLGVVLLFLVIFLSGSCIALHARDRFGLLLAFGIILIISIQAAINIGVTTALLPNKGFPLPFISYGGSNLVFCMFGVGVLINIYRQGLPASRVPTRNVLRARIRNTPRL